MNDNDLFQGNPQYPRYPQAAVREDGKKPLNITALVLGIVSITALFLGRVSTDAYHYCPLISIICSTVGLELAFKNRGEKKSTFAVILCTLGFLGYIVFSVSGPNRLIHELQRQHIQELNS